MRHAALIARMRHINFWASKGSAAQAVAASTVEELGESATRRSLRFSPNSPAMKLGIPSRIGNGGCANAAHVTDLAVDCRLVLVQLIAAFDVMAH
jgi:hypothetical protein